MKMKIKKIPNFKYIKFLIFTFWDLKDKDKIFKKLKKRKK